MQILPPILAHRILSGWSKKPLLYLDHYQTRCILVPWFRINMDDSFGPSVLHALHGTKCPLLMAFFSPLIAS